MNSYSATLNYLYGLQTRGMKFGLRNMKYLLKSVGNPEKRFLSLHIAGTNGKGSTSAFLASILMEAGHKTALYTSPHLVRFTERIRINGKEISERRLAAYTTSLQPAIEEARATFFEATTCIAFQYFADCHVDLAVIEAGLGGRLDSTNVLVPLVSVITNIGLDHTQILGSTIRAIAREKGGIIKRGVPCVTASCDETAIAVLHRIAKQKRSTLYQAQRIVNRNMKHGDRGRVSFFSESFRLRNLAPGLSGPHQCTNAQLAVATIQVLKNHASFGKQISKAVVQRGLISVVKNTGIRGRLETLGNRRRYIMDVAHNPPGVHSLVEALQIQGCKSLVVVFGAMKDKDYRAMVGELAKISATVITVAPKVTRAVHARHLYSYLQRKGIPARFGGTVPEGLRKAKIYFPRANPILVTGSHYVVGEALQFLDRKKA